MVKHPPSLSDGCVLLRLHSLRSLLDSCALSRLHSLRSLFSDHMLRVPLVLTNAFHQFHIRKKFKSDCRFPRSRVGLGVVDRDFKIQMAEVTPTETFDRVVSVVV